MAIRNGKPDPMQHIEEYYRRPKKPRGGNLCNAAGRQGVPDLTAPRCCANKKLYQTRAEAKRAARLMEKFNRDEKFQAYRCRHCDMYHIGHAIVKESVV